MSNENKIEEDNILGKKVEREKESKLKSKSNIIRILIETKDKTKRSKCFLHDSGRTCKTI